MPDCVSGGSGSSIVFYEVRWAAASCGAPSMIRGSAAAPWLQSDAACARTATRTGTRRCPLAPSRPPGADVGHSARTRLPLLGSLLGVVRGQYGFREEGCATEGPIFELAWGRLTALIIGDAAAAEES